MLNHAGFAESKLHSWTGYHTSSCMDDPKGDKLYVNLSAAKVRRRLKGFRHGVRKVQSAGNKREGAMIMARKQ